MTESPILHLTAVVTREGDWYVARCLEVEATSQGETIEQALAQPPRGGGGLSRRGAGPGDVTNAAGDLVRRSRPGVTGRLPRGVSGKQAVSPIESSPQARSLASFVGSG